MVGILLTAGCSSLLAQANPAGGSTVAPPAAKTSQHAPKNTVKPRVKPAPRKPVETAAPTADAGASSDADKAARRDPFESLVNRSKDQNAGKNLPPGKAGLQVSTLRLDGIVKSSNGMIAVVSNPQARTCLLYTSFTKVIVVVDHDVDVHNYREVVWKALCAIDPERDVQFVLGPVDTLDHAQRMQDYGSRCV